MNPVLRWAGSKRKVLSHLRAMSPQTYGRYFEPFAGSAVLYFDLLPTEAMLGDLNPEVIATYEAIRDQPDEVCEFLYSIPRTTEGYYTVRSLDPQHLSTAQRAARLIYLMKACFNGVYRTNREGRFNVPLGSKFFALPDRTAIYDTSRILRGTRLVRGDFATAIEGAERGDFVYLDPPYSDGTRFRGEYSYQGSFQSADKERLVSICHDLTKRGVKILLSFKECPSLCSSLSGWNLKKLDVNRSVAGFAHSRRLASEILAQNY